MVAPRGHADIRSHGVRQQLSSQCAVWRSTGCVAERNGRDVLADERLSFGVLA